MMKVAASMRSGMMRCLAPCSLSTPLHADGGRAGALDVCAHLVEQGGEVDDLRLAGAILQDGLALGERGGHEQVFGAGDGDLVENDFGALEPFGAGFDVAVILADLGAEAFQAFDVQVDGTRADGAAAGQRNAGASAARHQRAEHQRGGAHGLDQVVGGFGRGEIAAADGGAMLGAAVAEFDLCAHGGEQPARRSRCRAPAECFPG